LQFMLELTVSSKLPLNVRYNVYVLYETQLISFHGKGLETKTLRLVKTLYIIRDIFSFFNINILLLYLFR